MDKICVIGTIMKLALMVKTHSGICEDQIIRLTARSILKGISIINIYALSFLFLPTILHSQTFINDGNFELIRRIKVGKNETFSYKYWNPLFRPIMYTKNGAPDYREYIFRCKSLGMEPKDWFKPYSGNSYLTSILTTIPNIFESKLNKPLLKDSIYILTYYYKVISSSIPFNEVNKLINCCFGVSFSNKSIDSIDNINKIENNIINIPILFPVNNFDIRYYNNKYLAISIEVKPNFNYHYIQVGSFKNLMEAKYLDPSILYGVSWRIDSLSISKCFGSCVKVNPLQTYLSEDSINPSSICKLNLNESSDSVKMYYHYRNIAEHFLLKRDTLNYINYFNTATDFKYPFYVDYYNSWLIIKDNINLNTKSILKFIYNCNKLFQSKDFIISKLFYFKSKSTKYNIFEANKYLNNIDNIKVTLDSSMCKLIDYLYMRDSLARSSNGDIEVIDKSNIYEFKLNFLGKFYVNELNIGINRMRMLELLWQHWSRYNDCDMVNYLEFLVLNGHINNRYFAEFYDSYLLHNNTTEINQTYFQSNSYFVFNNSVLYWIKFDKTKLGLINYKRNELYLDNYETYIKLLKYCLDSKSMIKFNYGLNIIPLETIPDLNDFIKRNKFSADLTN